MVYLRQFSSITNLFGLMSKKTWVRFFWQKIVRKNNVCISNTSFFAGQIHKETKKTVFDFLDFLELFSMQKYATLDGKTDSI